MVNLSYALLMLTIPVGDSLYSSGTRWGRTLQSSHCSKISDQTKLTVQWRSLLTITSYSGEGIGEKSNIRSGQEQSRPDSPGQGEWPDWENDAYVVEDYEFDTDEAAAISSFLTSMDDDVVDAYGSSPSVLDRLNTAAPINDTGNMPMTSSSGQGEWSDWELNDATDFDDDEAIIAADDWEGWSEEPPYFDEDDIQNDSDTLNNMGGGQQLSAASGFRSSNLFPSRAALSESIQRVSAASEKLPQGIHVSSEESDSKGELRSPLLESDIVRQEMDSRLAEIIVENRKRDRLIEENTRRSKFSTYAVASLMLIIALNKIL